MTGTERVYAPALTGAGFDRDALHRTDEAYLADAWTRARTLPVGPRGQLPVDAGGRVQFEAPQGAATDEPRRFLGISDGVPYFSLSRPAGEDWRSLRDFGPQGDDVEVALAAAAVALENWHQRHTRCPLCGEPTTETRAGWTRTCSADGSEHFPRTDPAVIMLIHDGGDNALLGRSPAWAPGRFSTLAGFVEPGESCEAAVAREVFEEVGVGVRDVRYVSSQPWPFPASLMLGFVGRLDGDPELHLDPVEMAEAGWFTRAQIRAAADWTDSADEPDDDVDPAQPLHAIPPRFSISRFLIDSWLAGDI